MKKIRANIFGKTAFSSSAPRLWIRLPEDLRAVANFDSFKYKLDTDLLGLGFTLKFHLFLLFSIFLHFIILHILLVYCFVKYSYYCILIDIFF